MSNLKYIFVGIICFFLVSCITYQSDTDVLRNQLQALERQQQRDVQDMAQRLEDYQTRLETVDQTISQTDGSVQTTQASLWADVQSMRVQLATLTGRLDSLEREYMATREQRQDLDQTLNELRAKTRDLDRSVQMISSQLGVEIADPEAVPAPVSDFEPVDAPDPAPVRGDTAQALYRRALDSFYDRNYDQAQALWGEFTDNFPGHALASNAYFWQGESFFQMQNYAQAALAYQEVITNFPQSNKINSSMLKQGMSFYHLGRKEAGELVLNELIRKFPDTAEARRARTFMSDQQ